MRILRTPGTKRAVLKAILTNRPSKRAEEMGRNLRKIEEPMKRYEVLAGKPLDETLAITVIMYLCVKERKDRLEVDTKDMAHSEVREEIMSEWQDESSPELSQMQSYCASD